MTAPGCPGISLPLGPGASAPRVPAAHSCAAAGMTTVPGLGRLRKRKGEGLATSRYGSAWPNTIRSAHWECADRLQAGAARPGRFRGSAGSASGLAGLGQEPFADPGVRARWVRQDDAAGAVVSDQGTRLVRLGHARQGRLRPGPFLDLPDLRDRRDRAGRGPGLPEGTERGT